MSLQGEKKQDLKEWVRRNSADDSALSHLLQFTYRFFSKHMVQAFGSFLGTVVIAVMVGRGYYGLGFWFAVVLYAVILFLIAIANEHITGKIKDVRAFQDALSELGGVQLWWAKRLREAAMTFRQVELSPEGKIDRRDEKLVDLTLGRIGFQEAADAVCKKLGSLLSQDPHHTDVYVTVFQRFPCGADGEENCGMIACSEESEPTCFYDTYPIPGYSKELYGNIEYHTYLFALNKSDISVLVNREEVKSAFRFHEKCGEREREIEQYLGIPISPKGLGVTFLLQLDTTVPEKFGSDEHSMQEFAKNVVYPFAQFLHMVYEEGRAVEQLSDKLREEIRDGTNNET